MKVFLNNFENSSSSITKNQVATILNKTIEEAGFEHLHNGAMNGFLLREASHDLFVVVAHDVDRISDAGGDEEGREYC